MLLAIRADQGHHREVNYTLGSMNTTDTNLYGPGRYSSPLFILHFVHHMYRLSFAHYNSCCLWHWYLCKCCTCIILYYTINVTQISVVFCITLFMPQSMYIHCIYRVVLFVIVYLNVYMYTNFHCCHCIGCLVTYRYIHK